MLRKGAGYSKYGPRSGDTDFGTLKDVYRWAIDAEYDYGSSYAHDVHFPNVGTGGLEKLEVGFRQKINNV